MESKMKLYKFLEFDEKLFLVIISGFLPFYDGVRKREPLEKSLVFIAPIVLSSEKRHKYLFARKIQKLLRMVILIVQRIN